MKEYDDKETLAKLYWTLNENGTATYQEMADELGCSAGTISIRFSKWGDEIKENYSKNDFELNKHIEKLEELSNNDVLGVVATELQERFDADCTLNTNELESDILFLKVFVSDGSDIDECISKAYDSGFRSPCVAVSEHLVSKELRERFTAEAPGLLSVNSNGITLIADCNLTKGSTVRPILGEYDPHTAYHSAGWLNMKLQETSIQTISETCSLRPPSVTHFVERFNLEQPASIRA